MSKFNKHIVITGSARSGTSWLAEIIALQFRYRLLFEPEHEFQTTNGALLCDSFISEANVSLAQRQYLTKVFRNNIDSDWIAQMSNRKYKMHLWPYVPKKYIIKFVRCNLSAHYINTQFNIPTVFLIRNPYDVVLSQNRVKFSWLYNLNYFKSQITMSSFLKDHYDFSWDDTARFSEVEILTLRWCIENKLVFDLNPAHKSNFKIVKYEALKSDISAFYELCDVFKIKPLTDLQDIYSRPSSKTHPKSSIRLGTKKSNSSTDHLVSEISGILKRFNINY